MHASGEQLGLVGVEPPHPTDGLFFAVFPDAGTAARMAVLAEALHGAHRLRGKPLLEERLHATLHHLGNYVGLPPDLVASAIQAANRVCMPAFDVTFDCASSFSGGRNRHPYVLLGTTNIEALRALQHAIGEQIIAAGLGRHVERNFTPHVTLLYDDHEVAGQSIEPISWSVREFVLVRSLLGRAQHRRLGHWLLPGSD